MSQSPVMFLFNNRLKTDMSFFNLILQVVAHLFPQKNSHIALISLAKHPIIQNIYFAGVSYITGLLIKKTVDKVINAYNDAQRSARQSIDPDLFTTVLFEGTGFFLTSSIFIAAGGESLVNMTQGVCVIFPVSLVVGFLAKEILNKLGLEINPIWRKRAVLMITSLISIPLGSAIAVQHGLAPSINTGVMASLTALTILSIIFIIP